MLIFPRAQFLGRPGKFAPVSGMLECLTCKIGKFQSSQGQSNCRSCLPGQVVSLNAPQIVLVELMYTPHWLQFGDEPGTLLCSDCGNGHYSFATVPGEAISTCTKCPSGQLVFPIPSFNAIEIIIVIVIIYIGISLDQEQLIAYCAQ